MPNRLITDERQKKKDRKEAEVDAENFYSQERAAVLRLDPELRRIIELYAMKRA